MLTRSLAIAALTLLPVSAAAEPMWETADVWVCETESHFKISVAGENLRVNEEKNRKVIDFTDGYISTGFGDVQGWITGKRHYDGRYGGFHLLEVEYGGHPYPQIIVEKNGEYWNTAASGHSDEDRELWIANYKCRPQG